MSKYSLEFKLKVVNYCIENHCGCNVCANHFRIDRSFVKLWTRKYNESGIDGLKSIIRKKRKYNSYKGTVGIIADNLLERNFKADKPNEKWVTDVTKFKVNDEKVYLSPIVDLFNGEIISYSLATHPVFSQVVEMLDKAFAKIPNNTNLILHSDQGWQYQMKQYQHLLHQKGIRQSMSRKGNCIDNACAENFFGLLKSELYYIKEKEYKSIEELENDII